MRWSDCCERREAPRRDRGRKPMRALALFVTALWAAIVAPALADGSPLDAILERHVLRVGTTGDYRPFTALDKGTGEYSGFDIDMARALAEALGVSVAFAPTTWGRLAKGLADGEFDISRGGVSVTLDRQKIGFFSAPYMRDGKTPIARCADQAKYETLAEIDRPGVRVIANPGGARLGACPSNSGFWWRRLSESDSAWVMSKTFRPWTIDQPLLLPARVQDFVGEDHLARFVLALVLDHLDLREIEGAYGSERGQPPFDPAMMTALLLYAYCNGVYSSRRIAKASRERVDFISVVGLDAPDFRTVSDFRKRHLKALAGLFTQVLKLCEQAGLAKLGHVALDGTKIKANASKHKAMSYERMAKRAAELEAEVARWMSAAEALDGREDAAFGRDKNGDEMPDWVADKKKRAEKIRAAQAELEAEAKAAAAAEAKARAEAEEKRKAEGRKKPGKPAAPPSEEPDPKAQKNFTDPESRIMKTKDGFIQGYNAQAAVDATAQVIVAHGLDAKQSDQHQLAPIADAIEANLGKKPTQLSADAGYCSDANLAAMEEREIDAYIAPGRAKHAGEGEGGGARVAAMRERIKAGGHSSPYRLRKQLPEPVFGQIKQARGFRQFLLRGVKKVAAEWGLVCLAHNILKLAQGRPPSLAALATG